MFLDYFFPSLIIWFWHMVNLRMYSPSGLVAFIYLWHLILTHGGSQNVLIIRLISCLFFWSLASVIRVMVKNTWIYIFFAQVFVHFIPWFKTLWNLGIHLIAMHISFLIVFFLYLLILKHGKIMVISWFSLGYLTLFIVQVSLLLRYIHLAHNMHLY
mgnify:CR=1 FL=1